MALYAQSVATILPLLVLAVAVIFGLKAGLRAKGFAISLAALPLSLAVNPLAQQVVLESRDDRATAELVRRVGESRLVGQPPTAVEAVLGPPRRVRSVTPEVFTLEGRKVWEGQPRTVWEYQPFPYYWNGSTVRVTFENGTVAGISGDRR